MSQSTTLITQQPSLLTRLWRLPAITVARFTLSSHVRSGWILGDLVFIWLLYALFFLEFGGDVAYFYGTAGEGLSALAILSSIIIAHRALTARMYLPLARLSSRGSYIRGVILATVLLRIPSFLLMLALGASLHTHQPAFGIQGATLTNMLPGALGLLINTIILAILTVTLSVPVATRRIQILFLVWLVALLYSNSTAGQFLSFTRLPLVPISTCYTIAHNGIDGFAALMIVIALAYIALLIAVGSYWFSRRDLILH